MHLAAGVLHIHECFAHTYRHHSGRAYTIAIGVLTTSEAAAAATTNPAAAAAVTITEITSYA